jgi:hypothetical protein
MYLSNILIRYIDVSTQAQEYQQQIEMNAVAGFGFSTAQKSSGKSL